MKHRMRLVFVAALAALVIAIAAPSIAGAFVLSGEMDPSPFYTYLTLFKKDPVTGAWKPELTTQTLTTSSHFSFDSVPAGTYRLLIQPQPYPYGGGPAYLTSWWPSAPYLFAAEDIVIDKDRYLVVPAAAFGLLGGTVRETSGTPVGAQVDCFRWDPNGKQWYHSGRGADAGLDGTYYDSGVMAGEYRVRFSFGGYKVAWLGGSTIDSSTPVVLENGGRIWGLDATMTPGTDRPAISMSAPSVIPYGGKAKLAGRAMLGGAPDWNGKTKLQISTDGRNFQSTTAATTTDQFGLFSFTVSPKTKTWYRASYTLWSFPVVYTPVRAVSPAAYVSTPSAPTTAYRSRTFTSSGYLKPRHRAGTAAVKLRYYRYESGKWILRKTVNGIASDYSSYSRYKASAALPYAGKWRVRAQHAADTQNASSYSGWKYFSVK